MKTLRILTLLGAAAAFAHSAPLAGALQGPPSTDFYVSATGGSNANDGQTPATAWRTLTHALANVPQSVGGVTVNRFCGSSMQAIHMAAGSIALGAGDV